MKIFDKTIQSPQAPKNTDCLWDDGRNLKIYRNGKWQKAVQPMSDETTERLITILDNHKESVIEFTQDENHNIELAKNLDLNTNYICNYKLAADEILHGTYYNGIITTFYNGKLTDFNVNFDSGNIYIIRQIDPQFIATRIVLDVCSPGTQEAQLNLERLRKTLGGHFFCDIDHGLGVGTFNDGVGGYAHITTAYGVDTYYTIAEDGSITVDTSKKSLLERVEQLEQIIL